MTRNNGKSLIWMDANRTFEQSDLSLSAESLFLYNEGPGKWSGIYMIQQLLVCYITENLSLTWNFKCER